MMSAQTLRIRNLNDALRTTLIGGQVMMTSGVQALGAAAVAEALTRMRTFTEFSEDNDPHGEHDFGSFEVNGSMFFFKIDYYDKAMQYASEDPGDPTKTARVLTLMLASEY
jgi:hypothetical protein